MTGSPDPPTGNNAISEALAHHTLATGDHRLDAAEMTQLVAAITEQRAALGRVWQIDVDEFELSAVIWPGCGH